MKVNPDFNLLSSIPEQEISKPVMAEREAQTDISGKPATTADTCTHAERRGNSDVPPGINHINRLDRSFIRTLWRQLSLLMPKIHIILIIFSSSASLSCKH